MEDFLKKTHAKKIIVPLKLTNSKFVKEMELYLFGFMLKISLLFINLDTLKISDFAKELQDQPKLGIMLMLIFKKFLKMGEILNILMWYML